MVSIDITKFVLSLLVVLLHVNGTIFQGWDALTWINQCLGAFAVPCFLVYSGYFFGRSLLKRPLGIVSFDTIKRLVILSVVYQSIWLIFLMENGSIITRFIASDDRFMFIVDILFHLLCDGLYQFWYITAALMGIILMTVFIHYRKVAIGFWLSVVCFVCSVVISTWYIPCISDIVIEIVKPMDIVVEDVSQSVLCAWIFLWIGYGYSQRASWVDHYKKWIYGISIFGAVVEIALYRFGYGHQLSLWMVSPFVALSLLMITIHHPSGVSKPMGLWLRHLSTLIYCLHYQLSFRFASAFTQGVAVYDPLVTPLLYFGILAIIVIGLEWVISKATSHNRHHWLTYLF